MAFLLLIALLNLAISGLVVVTGNRNFSIVSFRNIFLPHPSPLVLPGKDLQEDRIHKAREIYLAGQAQSLELEYPKISNLKEFFAPLFKERCHILVDNFHKVNILPLTYPIVLRSVEPAVLFEMKYGYSDHEFMWASAEIVQSKINFAIGNSEFYHCMLSKYLSPMYLNHYGAHNNPDYCGSLEFFRYAVSSKPWSCQLQILIYPDLYLQNILNHPDSFKYSPSEPEFFRLLPTKIPPVHIYINYEKVHLPHDTILPWMKNIFKKGSTEKSHTVSHNQFLLINATYTIKDELLGDTATLQVVQYLKTWNSCNNHNGSKLYSHILHRISTIKAFSNFDLSAPSPVWFIPPPQEKKVQDEFLYQLHACDNRIWEGTITGIMQQSNPLDKLVKVYAFVWFAIVRNSSFVTSSGQTCKDGKLSGNSLMRYADVDQYDAAIMALPSLKTSRIRFPVVLENKVGRLQFISCGQQRGFQKIPFDDLFSVFDGFIWCLLVLSLASLAVIVAMVSRKYGMRSKNLATLSLEYFWKFNKVILEQTDPDSSMNVPSLRMMIGSFLLVSIVLSHAYRNTNVYNMILPRKPIPYEQFQELLEDKFTVYSRSTGFIMAFLNLAQDVTLDEITANHHTIYDKLGRYSVHSEVSTFGRYFKSHKDLRENERRLMGLTWNFTSLHPSYVEIFKKILETWGPKLNRVHDKLVEFLEVKANLQNMFAEEEEKALFNAMNRCSKVAVLQPEYLCNTYAQRLRQDHEHVYVGKESYFDVNIGVLLYGAISPFTLERFRRTAESGIWEWWSNLVEKSSKLTSMQDTFKTLKTPTMGGNVLVIFLLLLAGFCLATMCLLVELSIACVNRVKSKVYPIQAKKNHAFIQNIIFNL